jgi:hypothetical protein
VKFEFPADGSVDRQVATITNDYATAFPRARLRLVLRRGTYRVADARLLQAFDADDGVRTILDVEIRVAAKTSVRVSAVRK